MSKSPLLSCIVLSCDSHKKGNYALHCLQSVLQQDFDDFEIIFIENSHEKKMNKLIKKYVSDWNRSRRVPVKFTFIDNPHSYSPGKARNIGVSQANSNILVFLDDDTIILGKDHFRTIHHLSSKYDHGYGAKRLWTKPKWFERSSAKILNELERGEFTLLKRNAGEPPTYIRGDGTGFMQSRSFIANFGFCKKDAFLKSKGFPDLEGYGFDDDWLMSYLFENNYSHVLLDKLSVAHISHSIAAPQTKFRNLILYYSDLIRRGYYWFHADKIMKGMNVKKEGVLEPLRTLHYDPRIEEAYAEYVKLAPLDLQSHAGQKINFWESKNRYSKIMFSQLVHCLQRARNLDEFVTMSRADFDNLAPVIQVAIKDCVSISKTGKIRSKFEFKFTQPFLVKDSSRTFTHPSSAYNQFPCDEESKDRRFDLLKKRYPYCEYLKFAVIGDDDFVSTKFANDYWAWPVIIEKDKRIVREIRRLADRFDVIEKDILDLLKTDPPQSVQTFMTDPPYTLHGALAFICCGLKLLEHSTDEKEFYVVLNQTMMGKNVDTLLKILGSSGVTLKETVSNFSQYKLPRNYKERTRANAFLKSMHVNPKALKYSSSSNLYIFSTSKPDVSKILAFIDSSKIYDHYHKTMGRGDFLYPLKPGTKLVVGIKAAEVGEKST